MRPFGLIPILLAWGCQENVPFVVTLPNQIPEATILTPEDGAAAREGYAVTLRGTVTDGNDKAVDLVATWSSDARVLCEAAPIGEDGSTSCEAIVGLDDGVITLAGMDPEGAAGTDTVTLLVAPTQPPTVSITSPGAVGPFYNDHDVAFAALIGDAEDAPELLTATWTDETGAALDIGAELAPGGAVSGAHPFTTGEHTVTLAVTDTTGKATAASATFSVGGPDLPPDCVILLPADGTGTTSDAQVLLRGQVTDPDVDPTRLTAAWSSDLDGPLGGGGVGPDGLVNLNAPSLRGGTHVLTLTGTDEVGVTCTASVTFKVEAPPTLVIDAPSSGSVYNEGADVVFSATVSDDGTAPQDLLLSWTTDQGGVLDTSPADALGVAGFSTSMLERGTHTITLTATDDIGLTAQATVTTRINGLPTEPGVRIAPAEPATGDDLLVTLTSDATDPEGDPLTYRYAWTVDGAATAYADATLPASATARGETWAVTVVANDGYGDSPAATAQITIGNTGPTLDSATLVPDPAHEGDTLTCTPGPASDPDGDAVSYAYEWTVNGAPIATTAASIRDNWWSHGDVVVCTVTPDDGFVIGAAVSTPPLTITNAAPSVDSVTITPTAPKAADALTCAYAGFADDDGDDDHSAYAWTVNGAPAGTGPALADGFAKGDLVTCTVTPNDGIDDGAALSAEVTVANTPPVLSSVAISPTYATEDTVFVCTPGPVSDDDNDAVTYSARWTVNGVTLATTAPTLTGADFSKGDAVSCALTPNDGTEPGAEVGSNAVRVVNTPPAISAADLAPDAPTTDDTIYASVTGDDLDGDAITYTINWFVNGVPVGLTGDSLAGSAFDNGDTVYAEITPFDGTSFGATFTTAPVVVQNTAPVASSVTLTPGSAAEDDTLVCTATGTDLDGDALTWSYRWTVNGASVAGGDTLTGADFSKGDVVVCAATPNDGNVDGAELSSNAVTIVNTPPALSAVDLQPAPATESSVLTCAPTADDADGDTLSYTIAWTVNGADAGSSTTLDGAAFDHGDVVTCTVTPYDGEASGAPLSSAPLTINNTAPVASTVTLTPASATEDDTLICSAAGDDLDGDTLTWSYSWTVNGAPIAATTSTLTGADFDHGDAVVCAATPDDGDLQGAPLASNPALIESTPPVLSSVTLTPASATESSTLVCTPDATDADGDAISYAYAWAVNGAPIAATTATLDGADFSKDDVVVCRVTPSDAGAAGTALSSNAVTVQNTAPTMVSADLTPTSASESDVLTCTPSATDLDGDAVSYSIQWSVNGMDAGAGDTLDGASFGSGDTVVCTVTPDDGTDAGASQPSAPVTIGNTAPVASSVALTPPTASETSTLTCSATTSDNDGDAVTLAYAWTVNGAPIAATTATLTGAAFDHGDVVQCAVTPDDGTSVGATVASNTVTVGNSAPALASVTLTSPAYEATTVRCTPVASDADGDAISYAYAWTVNGAPVASTTATLTGADFDKGDDVVCTVTPSDPTDDGAAMSSAAVTIDNTAPVTSAVALSPTSATESSTLVCTPTSTDADGDAVTYTYAWTVNGAPIAATTATLTGASFNAGNTVACQATPGDGTSTGAQVTSNTVTISSTAPVLSAVTLTPASAYETSTLVCTPTASDIDGDAITYATSWTVNGSAIGATTATLTGASFNKGDAVACRVTPSDASGAGAAMSASPVTIQNSAPVTSAVLLTPTPATESSTLTCAPTSTDADGDSVTHTYAWTVNGSAIAATTATLTGASFNAGNTVACKATASDGTTSGAQVTSNSVTISGTVPVLSAVTLTPSPAYEASTLTCTPAATDADGDAISYAYAWIVNGSTIGATTATLTGANFNKGNTVACRVTPSDASGAGTAMTSSAVTISNTAPVTSAVALTPSPAYETSTLTCAPTSSDADGDTVSYSYAWTVNGSTIGATTATLTGSSFAKGNTVACTATPTDGTNAGAAVSSSAVTIDNSAPVTSAVLLTPTPATESSTLTCAPTSTDADGDSVTHTYAWTVNGSAIAATTATLTGASFNAGNTVACKATASDGTTSGTQVTSNTVTISGTVPVLSAVTLTPSPAYEASTLTCTPAATDADGDVITYAYAWIVNGSTIGATTATLTGTNFNKGNTVACRVTPSDASGAGTAMTSSAVTISNTAPVTSAVALTPGSPTEASTLTCAPTSSDADGDSVTHTYAWFVNGSAIAPTTSTLTGTYFNRGNIVYCRATPSDGTASGTAVNSSTVNIGNTAPVVSAVSLTPTTAYETSTLSCAPTGSDADGDSVTYTYAWIVNGVTAAPTTSTLNGTYFNRGNTVVCRVTPSDGTNTGSAVSSSTVTILNTAPTAPTVSATPASPRRNLDNIQCNITAASTDVDSDVLDYDITWTVDGQAYPGSFAATGPDTTTVADDTIPAADTDLGSVWACTVTPFDGTNYGASASASATVSGGYIGGGPCSSGVIEVGYLPGWSTTYGSTSLAWNTIMANDLTFGSCELNLTNVGGSFSLVTLAAFDVLIIGDPSGGSRLYTPAEMVAIRQYLEGGYGGAYVSYLMNYLTADNSPILDLLGVDPATVTSGTVATSGTATVVYPSHPIVSGLPGSFALASYGYEQANTGDWSSADLYSSATFVIDGAGQSSVIANEDTAWRTVWATAYPEYNIAGTDAQRMVYNSLIWAAGYN